MQPQRGTHPCRAAHGPGHSGLWAGDERDLGAHSLDRPHLLLLVPCFSPPCLLSHPLSYRRVPGPGLGLAVTLEETFPSLGFSFSTC